MKKTNKILLNSVKLPDNVNATTQVQVGLENTNKPIPLNDIDTTVDQYEQFLKERKNSAIYRFYGVVNPIISNPLFNENVKIYRDSQTNEIKAKTILSSGIFEKDGWIGYYNDEPDPDALQFNDNKSALCDFFAFDPGYDRLKMLDSDGKQNYLLKITYPFESRDDIEITKGVQLKNGVPIIDSFPLKLNGRLYTGFKTPMNHGLTEGSRIQLINFQDLTPTNTLNLDSNYYRVFKLGDEKNNKKARTFVIDVNPADINFTVGSSTVKRVVRDKPSKYYVRRYRSLTVDYKDYDIYPAAYGTSYFNDDTAAYNFKTDIDVKGLVDNLGRPLSELYLTIVKNDRDTDPTSINSLYWNNVLSESNISSLITTNSDGSTRFWTPISGGYDLDDTTDGVVNYNIRAYGDPNYTPSTFYELIDESDEVFDGDIVEYNENDLFEKSLESVYHRVNTIYREYLNTIKPQYENKKEGYIYSPLNLIKIREFSNTINPVVNLQTLIDDFGITSQTEINDLRKSFKIPEYATEISPNVFKWRDILDIGFIDSSGGGVDYPFESGAHYMYLNKTFYLQRQDPPCEFILISEDITLGATDINNVDQDKFLAYLSDPTYLNYKIIIPSLYLNSDINPTSTEGSGFLVYNTNSDMNNGDGVGYYQWNGSDWNKTVFTLDSVGSNALNVLNYNGTAPLNIEVTLADYIGENELGKRDIAGGCIDLSILEENTLDDVC